MTDKNDIEYKLAQRELYDAMNELRKMEGLKPLPLPLQDVAVPTDGVCPEYCSFCGKTKEEVRKLVAGPSVFICDECVTLAYELIQDK